LTWRFDLRFAHHWYQSIDRLINQSIDQPNTQSVKSINQLKPTYNRYRSARQKCQF